MHAECHVCERGVGLAELVDREPAQKDEASTGVEGIRPIVDDRSEAWERDVITPYRCDVDAVLSDHANSLGKLVDLGCRELVDPLLRRGEVDPAP